MLTRANIHIYSHGKPSTLRELLFDDLSEKVDEVPTMAACVGQIHVHVVGVVLTLLIKVDVLKVRWCLLSHVLEGNLLAGGIEQGGDLRASRSWPPR